MDDKMNDVIDEVQNILKKRVNSMPLLWIKPVPLHRVYWM